MKSNDVCVTILSAGGIPFAITLPKAPETINADLMTDEQLRAKLKEGYTDMEAGRVQNAAAAFEKFGNKHCTLP